MSSPRELLKSYLEERALFVSASTVKDDRFQLQRFFKFLDLQEVTQVGAVTLETLHSYQRYLETVPGERGVLASGAYLYKSLSHPKLFLVWAAGKGLSLVDFSLFPLPHQSQSVVEVPTVDQVKKLLEAPGPNSPPGGRDRLILESFYTLGLRRRESHRLNVMDVSLSRATVRIWGKGQRERLLPLSDRLTLLFSNYLRDVRPHLRPYPNESALWVSTQNGGRLSYRSLQAIVTKYGKQVGFPEVYPHLLRHACATHMLEAGAELPKIQAFLGHSDPSSTERYTQVDTEQLKAVFHSCHPRGCTRQVEGEKPQ